MGLVMAVYIMINIQKKVKAYPVDDIEWALVDAIPLYHNISKLITEQTEGMKKDFRKNSVRSAKHLCETIEERWHSGNIKPIRDFEKNSLKDFKTNLRYRLIPAIENGDVTMLQKVETYTYNFIAYLYKPSIDGLIEINNAMNLSFPNKKPLMSSIIGKFRGYIELDRVTKHIVVLASLGIVSVGFGYTILTLGHLPLGDSINYSLLLMGILFATYAGINWTQGRSK
jgi:hypothetical protein